MPENILGEFIPLLGEAWESKKQFFSRDSREDVITRTLCGWITQRIRKTYSAWGVESQPELLHEKNGHGELISRCDITISVAAQKYIFECKRMIFNPSGQSYSVYASRYVTQGMFRFLSPSAKQQDNKPQYPSWCGLAGMTAYVLDGTIQEAAVSIHNAIDAYAHPEKAESDSLPLCPSKGAQHFLTVHVTCAQDTINMHHIIFGLSG